MAKNIAIKTIEGLEIKNLSRGYSMEWGEGGSMHCDIYWNGKKICEVTQEGNGGCADDWYMNGITSDEEIKFKEAVLTCLKRLDPAYSETSEYEWLRNKTTAKINADDLEALENIIEDRAADIKEAKKAFKDQWSTLCIIDQDWKKSYMWCNYGTVDQAEAYIKTTSPQIKYKRLSLIKISDNLNIL